MSIEREHFDKIKIRSFRNNLRIRALMLTKSWWEHPINSWRTRYFSFFLTSENAFLTKILSHWDLKVSRIQPGFGFFFFFEAVRESPTLAAPSSSHTRRFFKWGTPRTRPRPLAHPHVPRHVRPYHVGQRVCDDDDAPGRVPDHVLGHTVLLAFLTRPLPSTE